MQQQQHDKQVQEKLLNHISNRDFQQILQIVQKSQKNEQLLTMLLNACESQSNKQQQDYQNWIHILAVSIAKQHLNACFLENLTKLFDNLVALSSPKYAIIILKSLTHRMGSHTLGKFILCSFFYLFYMLSCDAVVTDLTDIYSQFEKSYVQIQQQTLSKEPEDQNAFISCIYLQSLQRFLSNILDNSFKINSNYIGNAVNLSTLVIKSLINQQNNSGILKRYQRQTLLNEITLQIASKINLRIFNKKPNLLFTRSFLNNISTQQNLFSNSLFAKQKIIMLLVRTINYQLQVDLNSPPKFNKIQQQFLFLSINYLCDQFLKQQINNVLIPSYSQIEEFIEKIQIYLGSINPQDILHKKIITTFVNLPFLNLESKQRYYAKLISKHNNISFKVHLITQYRQLLNPKCSRTVWIRSTSLLFKQLGQIQPNSSIDYIGHIISMAFFWKQILNRLEKQQNFIKTCYLNIPALNEQFQQLLKNLRQGLQVKVQVSQSQNNEAQRNQTNLCIFRISEIIQNS